LFKRGGKKKTTDQEGLDEDLRKKGEGVGGPSQIAKKKTRERGIPLIPRD